MLLLELLDSLMGSLQKFSKPLTALHICYPEHFDMYHKIILHVDLNKDARLSFGHHCNDGI